MQGGIGGGGMQGGDGGGQTTVFALKWGILLALLGVFGTILAPVQWILAFIGLALPSIFWWYATRKQKKRKYPLIIKRITVVEVGITLILMFLVALSDRKTPLNINLFLIFVWCSNTFGWLNLIGGIIYLSRKRKRDKIIRGTELAENTDQLQDTLDEKHQEYLLERSLPEMLPRLSIAGIQLPAYLEELGIFAVGSPGSGKSQAIAQLLSDLKQRSDFRVLCFDRNGEFTENFYDESKDLIFNPTDARTVNWSHKTERARPETIAAALVPDNLKDPFFSDAARSLLSDLYERCDNNAEIWGALAGLTPEELKDFIKGGISHRYFISEKTGGSVLSSLINYARFYKELPDEGEKFSFVKWAREGDPRSLFLPLFEEDSELYKPLYSAAFELVLKGLLSNEKRKIKTAIIIDELGALNRLRSLSRLLSESRKFGGLPIIGTQTEAQIRKTYGDEDTRILIQGTATKLILNCRDGQTATTMADLIGKQERLEINDSYTGLLRKTQSESIRETYTVMSTEIQALPKLEGYLVIADGTPPAKVKVTPRSYPIVADRLVQREI